MVITKFCYNKIIMPDFGVCYISAPLYIFQGGCIESTFCLSWESSVAGYTTYVCDMLLFWIGWCVMSMSYCRSLFTLFSVSPFSKGLPGSSQQGV